MYSINECYVGLKMLHTIVCVCILHMISAQNINSESTMRTLNSIEIQACVNPNVGNSGALEQVKDKLLNNFQVIVKSTAVYHVRTYTNLLSSGTCFLYVYQAISPEAARESVVLLNSVSFVALDDGNQIFTDVKVFPWKGSEESFLGLGWSINGNDILLWGSCSAAIILTCAFCMCIYVRVAIGKENALAKKRLQEQEKAWKHMTVDTGK